MRERNLVSGKGVLVLLAGLALVMSFACGKKSGAEKAFSAAKEAAQQAAGKVAPAPANVQNDYTKPYLTEEKMTKFIESMKEDVNPFEVLFKGGQMMNMSDIEKRAQEYNGFAQKYGFADFADYMAVWGRIMVGDMTIAGEKMKKDMIQGMEDAIKSAEEQLKKPDLSPDMRTMYEEQIKNSKESIEGFQKPDEAPGLNAEDVALVAKYKAQIDEATKKFNKKPGN
jgi:uncharacterized protein YeeX (DUF496 family)